MEFCKIDLRFKFETSEVFDSFTMTVAEELDLLIGDDLSPGANPRYMRSRVKTR
jgi:hypothetical protein